MKTVSEKPEISSGRVLERVSHACALSSAAKAGARLQRARSRSGKRGTVLIVVLWVCAALVAIALYFGNAMVMEYRASDNEEAGAQAGQIIDGARRYIAYVLKNQEEPGYMPDSESYLSEEVPVGGGVFWLIGRDANGTSAKGAVTFGLVDEASKLNLSTATLEMLEILPGMTSELAAAAVDWRDVDEDLTEGGAESQNYLLNDPPYYCKNSSFETVEELRLVMGFTRDVLYGEDPNLNGVLDPNEDDADQSPPADNRDGKLDAGVLDYVTVYSREPGAGGSGAYSIGRVNVNTAPAEVLKCLPGIGEEYAAQLVAYRQGKSSTDLQSLDWIQQVLPEQNAQQARPRLTTRSYQFAADIVALGHDGRGFRRELLVFDTSVTDPNTDGPVVVFRKDLTRLGWPLGTTVFEKYNSTERR